MFGRLFVVPDAPRRWFDIIIWWELRRIAYNVTVGSAGLVSALTFIGLASLHQKGFDEAPEPIGIVLFGIGANICYTGGWMAELLARLLWRDRAAFFGPVMFSLGLLFSVGVCLLFGAVSLLIWFVNNNPLA